MTSQSDKSRGLDEPSPLATEAPVLWWNGFRRSDPEGGTYPSVSEREDTNHDIPLYSGVNPCNVAVCGPHGCKLPCEYCAREWAELTQAEPGKYETPPSTIAPSEPPMVYDPQHGAMVRPGGVRALMNELRQLFDKTAEARDGDYADKVSHALVAVYAYGRRQTTASATPRSRFSLTPKQVAQLHDFAFGGQSEEDAMPVTIGYLDAHEDGPGWYVWGTEYPEEGALPLVTFRRADGGKQTKSNDS